MTRLSQWWKRNTRAGHAYAESAGLHGHSPERFRVREVRRAVLWGIVLPLAIVMAAIVITPWALVACLIYPVQVARLAAKGFPFDRAFFLTLGRFPEAQGMLSFWAARLSGRRKGLIEYK